MNSAPVMALQPVGAEQAGYWMTFPMSSPTLVDTVCSPKAKGGDLSASIDDAPIKIRKPYTITKQRERWTEDEHQKFLDALKLHGRAWRRIEEHIGTKTAVQIRSHAQKFFSKLEREASLGGSFATAGSGEIDIPPPRPKRKPSHPYPKKASGASSSSPSFEEDCKKSPPAVHSAFTPLESGTGATISKMPPKKIGSSAASLRLFGQNVVPGSDKVEADTDLMESTGSPRSQISVGTEETSGVSPLVSNTASCVWDQTASVSKPNEAAGPSSETKSQLCNAIAEWEKSFTAINAPSDGSRFTPWQPSSFALGGHHLAHLSASVPAFWQGRVPPSFAHSMNEDVNAAAAIAAATYAVASAWQAIQGTLTNPSNDSNTSIVYSPIAMLAPAREPVFGSRPQTMHAHSHEHPKRDRRGYCPVSGNEDEGTSLHGEESTAECCSSLTDTSRLSSYESNDEGVPVKKRRRSFHEDNMQIDSEAHKSVEFLIRERISKADRPSVSSEGYAILDESLNESNDTVAIHSRSTDDRMNGPSDKARTEKRSVNELQPEKDLHTAKIVSSNVSMDSNQPIIQACGLNSPYEPEEGSSKGKEALNDNNDSDKEIVSSSTVSQLDANKASIPKECINRSLHNGWTECNRLQIGVNGTCTESSEHVATLSSRYSGVGFVPYKKSTRIESPCKH